MEAHVPTPRASAGGPAKPIAALLVVAAIALLLVGELAAPHDLTLGTAVIVPVLVSCFVLDRRWAAAVLGLAVLTRVVVAIVGDTTIGLAALEVASYIGCVVIALVYSRRAESVPARTPFADVVPPSPQPNVSADALEAPGLTDRERQVLDMAIHGLTAKQIGERLFIGRRTVETHLGRARDKLGVRTKRDLIALTYDTRGEPQSGSQLPRTR
jgi:DNA-binding CsgD family transcriptional regulator